MFLNKAAQNVEALDYLLNLYQNKNISYDDLAAYLAGKAPYSDYQKYGQIANDIMTNNIKASINQALKENYEIEKNKLYNYNTTAKDKTSTNTPYFLRKLLNQFRTNK